MDKTGAESTGFLIKDLSNNRPFKPIKFGVPKLHGNEFSIEVIALVVRPVDPGVEVLALVPTVHLLGILKRYLRGLLFVLLSVNISFIHNEGIRIKVGPKTSSIYDL